MLWVISIRSFALAVLALSTTHLLSFTSFPDFQAENDLSSKPRTLAVDDNEEQAQHASKYFHVELTPNPPEQLYYQANPLEEYRCGDEQRLPFPSDLQEALKSAYTPRLATNMNIIVMGDSLGIQLSVLFQSVAFGSINDTDLTTSQSLLTANDRAILGCTGPGCLRDVNTLSPARGGGTIAGWRITGMLQQFGLTAKLPPAAGGGWRLEMAERMKNFSWLSSVVNSANVTTENTPTDSSMRLPPLGSFDVMIFRVPQIWIQPNEITRESLQETVELAYLVFGVKTIVFMDLPLVKEYEDTTDMMAANRRIRSFVSDWQLNRTIDAELAMPISVTLLELGTLITQVGMMNARNLGYDTTRSDFVADLIPNDPLPWPRPIATNCLEHPIQSTTNFNDTDICPINNIFFDGLHMCTETFGPRIVSAVGCLLECTQALLRKQDLHECERACNRKHMRLDDPSTTLPAAGATATDFITQR
ncbi:hypothetical protein MPSEU_001089900 [Mayamaea pseudoterrestris]|nr:hypothetical protein MPSEU_001089900 [Mayamaea pseudoterrestris]